MRIADSQNPLPAVMAAAIEAVLATVAGGLMLLSDSRRMEPGLFVSVVLMLAAGAGLAVGFGLLARVWQPDRASSG